MKIKWVNMYLDFAKRLAQESHARRLKVGAVLVTPDGVVSTGINGLPAGGSNECEYEETGILITKPEVSHAEESLVSKILLQGVSTKNSSVFLTHSPCINCAKILVNAKVKEVYYISDYRSSAGIDWLKNNNVPVIKIEG